MESDDAFETVAPAASLLSFFSPCILSHMMLNCLAAPVPPCVLGLEYLPCRELGTREQICLQGIYKYDISTFLKLYSHQFG